MNIKVTKKGHAVRVPVAVQADFDDKDYGGLDFERPMIEVETLEDILGRGAGDPDIHGYLGEGDEDD